MLCQRQSPWAGSAIPRMQKMLCYHGFVHLLSPSVQVGQTHLQRREPYCRDRRVSVQYPAQVPPLCPSRGAVGLHNGAVHKNQSIFAISRQGFKYVAPHTSFGPADIAIVNRCVPPISFRQIAPRRTRAQYIENPVQNQTIILAPWTTPWLGQKRKNYRPFCICKIKSAHIAPVLIP